MGVLILKIRNAVITDLESIVEIYNHAVKTNISTADIKPVGVSSRLKWFQEHKQDKYPIFVYEEDNKVIGWISLSPYRPGREALRYTAEVSYYIHEDFQRKGIGSKLLEYVIQECSKYEIKTLFAIILEINSPSIGLMKKFGFEEWAHLPKIADFYGKECGQVYYGRRVIE
jgi:phosphinothricin acetyltransferase